MNKKNLLLILVFATFFTFCQQTKKSNPDISSAKHSKVVQTQESPLITFIELGSVNCIPCRKMQPVMKRIEEKYGNQIKVIFYDVWKPEQRHYAQKYHIRLIPTQIFLNKEGQEIFRHEGFFPESEIDEFLQSQGLVAKSGE